MMRSDYDTYEDWIYVFVKEEEKGKETKKESQVEEKLKEVKRNARSME